MLAKLSVVLYFIAAILNFINNQMSLFWISLVLLIATTGLSMYMSYLRASPQLKEYRDTVREMESNGISDEKILEFIELDIEVDESKLIKPPLWMQIIVMLGIGLGFVLFAIGVRDIY